VFRQPHAVDVIIPVYGAAEDLRRCLASVARHTDLARHRVVIVLDGPQDDEVETIVAGCRLPVADRGQRATGNWQLLRNDTRLGFVKSANRGMRESTNEVVLLNSDTIVTADWLEKLIDAAYSSDRIATVTPLSNNATICTVTAGHDIDAFAAHVERVSQRAYPRLPTAVGFCMYIRRAALDDLGLFDEAFGLGYGEENDFCMRASARGWEHVADDATFIHHAGERSFGKHDTKPAYATLLRKHPQYMKVIAEFMRRDPLAPVRARIGSLRIVHLVHGWPPFAQAGTELYAYWLVRRQRERHHVAVYARTEGETRELLDDGVRVRLVKNDFTTRNPLRRNALIDRAMERDFVRFLREEKPDLLHVHHLAGHAFSLMRVAKRMRIPVVMQIQDWWFLCARVNRFDGVGRCSGPAPAKCARCVTLTKLPGNRALHALRRVVARSALRAADAYIAGSNAIRDDYAPHVNAPFHVIPYGVAIEPSRLRGNAQKPIRFGVIGSSGPHKGRHIAIEAMRGIDPSDAALHVFEKFEEADKPRIFGSIDVLLMPSIGLESFGLAAREAMACGVPVIATSGGAMDELPEAELVPPGDAVALRDAIRRLIDDPSLIDAWSARLPVPKSDREHAAEIERVYRTVL
jgi:GT2 family glycosyltransferase/glycosyltransferase involved in cell wall biosynthesis